jgi:parallel beta-helix repeat protein
MYKKTKNTRPQRLSVALAGRQKNKMLFKKNKNQKGIALIETLFSITILAFVALSLNSLFDFTLRVIWENKARAGAQSLANEKMEIARNLPYIQVGTQGGIPAGSILQTETVTINNIDYTVESAVIFVDDPFDGTQGGVPDDLLPSDYKRLRIEISWDFRLSSQPVVFLSDIAPKGLESELGGGTLRITALDSSGIAVAQANVHIENFAVTPTVDLNILTNDNGQVLLPGATPSIETYNVTVNKTGYSTDQTHAIDPVNLPTPIKPPLSVIEGSVTDASFSVDLLSTINVSTVLAGDACGVTQSLDTVLASKDTSSPITAHREPLSKQKEETSLFHIALQDQIYVDGVTGNDTTGDGSTGNPYASLSRALQDIDQGEGDSINLAGGQVYAEDPFTLDNTYSGSTSTPTIIQSWSGTATATIDTLGDRVFVLDDVKHLILDHLALTGATNEGVLIQNNSTNITISNSLISGNTGTGIRLNGGGLQTITDNTINLNGSYGVQVESSVNTVQNNLIHDNTSAGIYVSNTSNDLIQNTLSGNDYGIEALAADLLINNNISHANDQHGLYIHHGGGQNTLSNNISHSNGSNGFLFESSGTNIVSNNQAYLNTLHGMRFDSASNTLSSNIVRDNILDGFYVTSDDNSFNSDQVYDNDRHGANLIGLSDNSLQGVQVWSNTQDGVRLDNCNNCSVTNSQIYSNLASGIYAPNSSFITIDGSSIYSNSARGVYLQFTNNAMIDHNAIYRQGSHGLELTASDNNTIAANTISQNTVDGLELNNSSTGNTVINNIISHNGSYGLEDNDDLSEPTDTYNLFYSNSAGHLQNTSPIAGGTGTLVDLDPLFVSLASDNYNLQSLKGYYPFGGGDVSTSHSPAIDSGDSISPYVQEPAPNGCNVNLGVYGNTSEASKSNEAGDPLPNLDFTLHGGKIIGQNGAGEDVYKYEQTLNSGASGQVSTSTLEWDSYTFIVNSTTTGYDIAYTDPYQPVTLLPNTTQNVEIGLIPDSQHTLHVLVIDTSDGQVEEAVDVRLHNTGLSYDETIPTPTHGQVFFENLQVATYTLEATKAGFQLYTISVDISFYESEIVNLSP